MSPLLAPPYHVPRGASSTRRPVNPYGTCTSVYSWSTRQHASWVHMALLAKCGTGGREKGSSCILGVPRCSRQAGQTRARRLLQGLSDLARVPMAGVTTATDTADHADGAEQPGSLHPRAHRCTPRSNHRGLLLL